MSITPPSLSAGRREHAFNVGLESSNKGRNEREERRRRRSALNGDEKGNPVGIVRRLSGVLVMGDHTVDRPSQVD